MSTGIRLRKYEINHVKTSMFRCSPDGIANELGRSKEQVEKVVKRLKAFEKLEKLSNWTKMKKKTVKKKAKRKLHGGM